MEMEHIKKAQTYGKASSTSSHLQNGSMVVLTLTIIELRAGDRAGHL